MPHPPAIAPAGTRASECAYTLGATQLRMSRHRAVLRAVGLVTDRRDAQRVRYRRNPALSPAMAAVAGAVLAAMADERKDAA